MIMLYDVSRILKEDNMPIFSVYFLFFYGVISCLVQHLAGGVYSHIAAQVTRP
jgi:hypothetical protein